MTGAATALASAVPVGTDVGQLRVWAERLGNRTVVTDMFRSVPFHTGRPSDRTGDGAAELIVQSVGPGYLPGDRLAIDLSVGAGATLTVRGQGATKVYGRPGGPAATATVALSVAGGGTLIYLPGELIPFRDAALDQRTTIRVERGGRLALGEIVTPGRVAMGETDAYASLRLDVDARYDGRRCLVERARLVPSRNPLTSVARHGHHAVAGTLYLIGDSWVAPDPAFDVGPVTWAAVSGDGYILVRLLGPTAQVVSGAMATILGHLSPANSLRPD